MANDTESTTSTQRPAWYPGMWISRLYHGEGGSSSQRHQSPDIEKLPLFLYLLRTDYPDLWEECEKRGVTIAVPRAATIGNFTESVHFESHLLVPVANDPGTYRTLRKNQKVSIVGQELCAGRGFSERRCVQLLSMESLTEYRDRTAATKVATTSQHEDKTTEVAAPDVTLIHCSRPLVGGLTDAPDHMDAPSSGAVRRLTAALRGFVELEGIFRSLDKFVSEVNSIGETSEDGFGQIQPNLSYYLRNRWSKCVALIVNNIVPLATARANALIPFWSQAAVRIKHRMQAQSDAEMLKETLPTLVECYIMQRIHGTIHPWFQHQCAANEARMGDLLHQLRHLSPHDCGVRPPFQCSLDDAAAELSTLAAAVTPLEKLLVLKNTVRSIQSAVQRSLFRKSTPTPATAEEEYPTMATDDLVLLIVYTVILSAPHTSSLLSEIHYIKTFHFVPMSTSHLGFILSTFEVAASWFTAKIPDFEQIEIGSGENADDTTTSSQFEEVPAHLKSIPRSITIEACRRNVHGLSADAAVEEEDGEQEFDFWKNSLFTPSKRGGDHFGNISSPNSFLLATTSFLSPMALKFGGEDASSKQEEHDPVQHGLVLLSRRETSTPGDVGISCASSDNGQLPQADGKALSPLQLQFDKSAALAAAGESSTQAAVPLVDCAIGEHCFAAVTTNGALLTWGVSKNHSCLGHGGESESSAENQDLSGLAGPTRVVGKLLGTTVAAVACGDGHVLALLTRGAVYSWGENDWGQLGTDGGGGETEPSRGAPAHIAALESYQVISIACGARHSLAVTNAGQVYSWGMCKCGQLGRLSEGECHKTPRSLHDDDDDDDLEEAVEKGTSVDGADTMDQENKSRRGRHTVPERIECDWVFRPAPATTAMGKQPKKEDSKQQPTVSSSVAHAIAVTAGSDHSIVITSEGAAYSFGCGLDGRLGHGCHSDAFHPIQVRALAQLPDLRIVGAAAGAAHSLFRTADGALFGCGSNRFGQVGVHTELHGEVHDHAEAGAAASDTASSPAERGSVLVPLRILGELDGLTAVDITAGSWHSVATMEASSGPNTREKKQGDADLVHSNIARMLFAWGSNLNGRLGIGSGDAQVSMVDEPREIKVATRRLSVAVAGGQHTAYFDITPEAHRIAQARRHGREGGWGGEKS